MPQNVFCCMTTPACMYDVGLRESQAAQGFHLGIVLDWLQLVFFHTFLQSLCNVSVKTSPNYSRLNDKVTEQPEK